MIPVFVNDVMVMVEPGTTAAAAAAQHDPKLEAALAQGRAYLTDGRGIRLPGETAVTAGAILRVIMSARRAAEESDAQP